MTLEMKSDRIIRLTHRQSNRAALVRGDHMALPARVRHIRAEALQQRIRRAGEKANARRLQPVNKPSSFNHLSPSFHIREAYLFTIHYCLFPAPDYAPRPWGMQPNTSFRLRMCISPLMSSPNIIPFSPCPRPLLRIICAKTGLTSFRSQVWQKDGEEDGRDGGPGDQSPHRHVDPADAGGIKEVGRYAEVPSRREDQPSDFDSAAHVEESSF